MVVSLRIIFYIVTITDNISPLPSGLRPWVSTPVFAGSNPAGEAILYLKENFRRRRIYSIVKRCPVCGKPFDAHDGDTICPQCKTQYVKLYRKLKCLEYLGGKCVGCGRSDVPVLTFHHRDSSTKEFNIGEWIGGARNVSWEIVKRELDKCEIRCFNCHRLIHTAHHHELKEFIPYLTRQQKQDLESDVINDVDLLKFMEDDETVRDLLMEPMEEETEHNHHHSMSSYKQMVERARLTTEKLSQASLKELEERPGGILGITPLESFKKKSMRYSGRICCYCGEKFDTNNELQLFCSDYCQEQSRDEAIENGHGEIFDYLISHGVQMAGSIYRMKQRELYGTLGFVQ